VARQPQVSGKDLITMLQTLGYAVVRRKGSHVRLKKTTAAGEHSITVPDHRTLAKGTLSDIVAAVSVQNGIPKQDLMDRLRS
jgi:predicted RNA binding protein YcfA (HicA-like mRNA interferase family)